MIKVDRYRKESDKQIAPSEEWFSKARALKVSASNEGPGHRVANLYKDSKVTKALEYLFHYKCAYCETNIADSEWDVEHYRPKGRVAERSDHPGYYWLAYSWENLYPSCKHCNQRRRDKPLYDDPRDLPSGGKADRFPLVDENERAMSPEHDLGTEEPLLLNPCLDNPEEHLAYDIQGQIRPIDESDRQAVSTIELCHLGRRRLRDRRAKLLILIDKIASNICEESSLTNTDKKRLIDDILEPFAADDGEYTGLVRAIRCDPDAFLTAL